LITIEDIARQSSDAFNTWHD